MSAPDAAVPADTERDDATWALTEELEEARDELARRTVRSRRAALKDAFRRSVEA